MRPWYWPKEGQPHRIEPFTWIVHPKIAASWWPDPPVFEIYKIEGIKVIINCSEFDNKDDIPEEFVYYHINIPDLGIPSKNQINRFLGITDRHIKNQEPIVVHCVAGCGRTGQLIVAWGSHNGVIPENKDPVEWIRNLRPCCLETEGQKAFARNIARKLAQKP